MATFKTNKGSNSFMRGIIVRDAFVQNSTVEAELQQPKGTFISNVYLRFLNEVPEVPGSGGADLGFKIGTTTGGVEIAAAITDGVLDNAGNDSSLIEENSIIVLTASLAAAAVPVAEGQADLDATVGYASDDRTLFLQTTATDATVDTAGDVEWIVEFKAIGTPA